MTQSDHDMMSHVAPSTVLRTGSRNRDRLGAVACMAAAVFALTVGWVQLGSLDTGYHVAYGRQFLDHGEIVDHDPFLMPEVARPFVNANWGSQVVMAVAERWGGAWGLIVLRTILLGVIFGAVGLIVIRATHSRHWLAWTWLAVAAGAYERFSLRPELFSYALMAVMLAILVRGIRSWRGVALVAALQLAWVNLHSYFLIGLILTGAWLAGDCFTWFRRRRNPADASAIRRRVRLTAIALGVQVAVCFINPWHYHGFVFPFETLRFLAERHILGGGPDTDAGSPWSAITEFHSPFAHVDLHMNARTIRVYLVLLVVSSAAVVAAAVRGRLASVLVIVAMAVMSTRMRRNIAQFAIGAVPIASVALAAVLAPVTRRRAVRHVARWASCAAMVTLSVWWTAGIVSGRFYYAEERINREFGAGYNERMVPRAATQWLARQPELRPALFVDYFASSNTLLWLPRRFHLLVDTNTFAYDESTLSEVERVGRGQADHRAFFHRWDVNVVLLSAQPNTERLIRALAGDIDWALVYFDRHTVIFIRRRVEHVPVIAQNRLHSRDLDPAAWIDAVNGPEAYRALELGTAANVPLSLGWYRAARDLLREVVRIAPDHARSWNNLGKCHAELAKAALRNGRFSDAMAAQESALEAFASALALTPEDDVVRHNHAAARQNLDRLKRLRSPSR